MLNGYVWASAADVLRSAQKDREYVTELITCITEATRTVCPPRHVTPRLLNALKTASTLLYYTGTSVAGVQTLGEEYCDLFEIGMHSGGEYAPSVTMRAIMTLAHALGADVIRASLRGLLRANGLAIRDESLNALFSWLQRAHLALFYWSGTYYEIPKRIAAIGFLRVAAIRRRVPRYSLLGVLLAIQVIVTGLSQIRQAILATTSDRTNKQRFATKRKPVLERIDVSQSELDTDVDTVADEDGSNSEEQKVDRTCILCLSKLTNPTTTECGHVFCWNCIAEWCSSQELCPLCRQSIQLRGLLCLYHY